MIIVDRYIYDVTRRLPEHQRDDVARELRADIVEMIEDQAGDKKPTTKQVSSALLQLGRPSKLADSYRDQPRYIIGPEYYESYISLLKIILVVVIPIVVFLDLMAQLMVTQNALGEVIAHVVGAGVEMTVHIFFWTTLSFIAISKVTTGKHMKEPSDWDPKNLPEVPTSQTITRNESYFAIAWSLLAIIATILQVPAVNAVIQPDVPLFFTPDFWPYWTLGLLAVSFLSLFAELIKMAVGKWSKSTATMITVVNSVTIGFFVSAYYSVQSVIDPEFTQLIERTFDTNGVAASFNVGVIIFVNIVVIISVWEIIEAWIKYKKGGKK